MLRRSHKKSRRGCLECKRRHVKCDEGRPVCLLCTMSGRDCSFASLAQSEALSTSEASSHGRSISPYDVQGRGSVSSPVPTPLTKVRLSYSDSPERPYRNEHQVHTDDEAVNLDHMELLIHLTLHKHDMFNLGANVEEYPMSIYYGLKRGLEAPYLLHQLLAFSARHLAFLYPERSTFYLHQAVSLQTRAVSLFNASFTEVDQSNCVPILLFSAILGHQFFADMLAKRGGLDTFITHYVQCVDMHRGIYTIATTAWPLLMESEIEPVLSWSSGLTSRQPKGSHCQRLSELVDGADGLKEKDKEACRLAIQYLQVAFDVVLAEEVQGNRFEMLVSWLQLAPPDFRGLLAAQRPEGLVLLGYYALLLHYGRSMWQVEDAGEYIFGMIADYLGPDWGYWLEYPREIILG